ncbi:di-heme oxidoredictase family protein [Flavobacterium sp.]|uniref:di-heme oxidoredictase family protein n=1 Tax=Flavobacterium sp. TaxID=239 RepID=UPI001221E1F8|nr:MAG: hypothetical protein EOO49_02295 [Flavobacterium sp.]
MDSILGLRKAIWKATYLFEIPKIKFQIPIFFPTNRAYWNRTEAILWHAGEATNAKNAFKQLNVTEHTDLLNFINSMIFPG